MNKMKVVGIIIGLIQGGLMIADYHSHSTFTGITLVIPLIIAMVLMMMYLAGGVMAIADEINGVVEEDDDEH